MRRPSLHWLATIPAAVALAGAAVLAAQPFFSARHIGGSAFDPDTGSTPAGQATSPQVDSTASDIAAGGPGADVAATVAQTTVAETTGEARAVAGGAAPIAASTAPVAVARVDLTPTLGAVGSSAGMASRLGRFAAPALPLGALGLFSFLAGPDGGGAGSVALDQSARIGSASDAALANLAPMAPARAAAGNAAGNLSVLALASTARATAASYGGVAPGLSAFRGILAQQVSAVRGGGYVTRWASLPARPHLDDLLGNVLTDEPPAAGDALLPTTGPTGSTGAVPPILDVPAVTAPIPPILADVEVLATPEPATMALVAGGLLLVAAARRRRSV